REAGMLEVSAAPAQDSSVEKAAAAAARVGRPDQIVPLAPQEVAQRVSSPVFRGGVFYPECATVHPGLLVRALRRAALDAGVTVHEGTPVTAVRAGSPNELETPDGIPRATGGRPGGRRRGCGGPCRGSRTFASNGRGAGRSTSRPTTCPSSARGRGRGSITARATPVTASGRAGSAAASSPRSRSGPTTS